jgi:predicted transcriptional regulator
MKVTTVRLPDDLAESVAEAANASERSQSEYIRHVLRNHIDSKPNTSGGEAVVRRLADLEARVEALEADRIEEADTSQNATDCDLGATVEGEAGRRDRDDHADDVADDEAVRAAVREAIGDGAPRKSHAREALVDTVALLADRGALATGDLKDELHPRFDEKYSTKKTMWNSLTRHLEELPGVYKPEYGTWGVDVDALVEGEDRAT